ncbi:TonB-dependent receptor domain-containing protein [Sphingomonas aerophila]|uniref:Outer membrane receptor protein involved in Fe transport n=1 Tax=Sphingomonas aerophila TaxID=1344948 RepID=A0A7W9BH77_9SPHN|nr:TonB-dependent receptor [Sphingomonas aerophila]MBB5717077.1 outer membrane receptor protein involved in Fe transport [Sphingomonas aerophila]
MKDRVHRRRVAFLGGTMLAALAAGPLAAQTAPLPTAGAPSASADQTPPAGTQQQLPSATPSNPGDQPDGVVDATGAAVGQTGTVNDQASTPDVVVTGSRIARTGFDASTPVNVVNQEDIKLSGNVNVERTLAQLPQAVGSQLGSATSNTVPGGFADVNLRGFGANRNLVLVNGRRFAIYGPEQVTDLNTIPSTLVARTEIVTGGSSAVYGSDAITGVVNFIIRDDFEGVEGRAQLNMDRPTGTPVYNFDLTVGGNFADNRGNVVVSGNYLKRGAITRGDRGSFAFLSLNDGCVAPGTGSATSAGTPFTPPAGQGCVAGGGEPGFVAGGSGDIPNGRFSGIPSFGGANAALNAAYTAAGLGGLGSRGFTFNGAGNAARPALTPQDDFNLGPGNYLIQPQERWMINTFGHYDFNDHITGYTELHFSNNVVDARLAPTNVGAPTLFNVNNPYLTPELQGVLRQLDLAETGRAMVTAGTASYTNAPADGLALLTAGRRYVEVGPRLATERRNVFRGAFGFRGDLGQVSDNFLTDLKYDIYYTYARSEDTLLLRNALSRSRVQASLLSVNGAAPVCNIFGANITDACASAIRISATNSTIATQQVAQGSITGNLFKLPAGPVGFSYGYEWRKTSARFTPDSFLASGDVVGFNPGLPTAGDVSVKEVFGEIRVPLIHDTPFIESLVANGAFRYSKYDLSGVGGVWTYLGGADWRVSRDLAFRGQYQRAIRAPNVSELYGGTSRVVGVTNDPCSNRGPASQQTDVARQLCIATGVPASQVFGASVQPNNIFPADFGGNPNLSEESSDTYTLGAVITPRFAPRLYLSVDYFNISLEGAVAALGGGAQNTLNLCYNVIQDINSEFCQAVRRNPSTGEINDPFALQVRNANTGRLKTSGIDFAARYRVNLGFGLPGLAENSTLDLGSNFTWLDEFTSTPVAAFPNIQNKCAGSFGPTCGQPLPVWRGTSRATWNIGDLSLSLRHRYIGPVTTDRYIIPARQGSAATPALSSIAYPKLGDRNYFDLSFSLDILKNAQLFGGANNIFNKNPPITTQGPNANTFSATYDVIGTEFFLGATVKF